MALEARRLSTGMVGGWQSRVINVNRESYPVRLVPDTLKCYGTLFYVESFIYVKFSEFLN
jgi:hypothetical protein